VRKNSLKLSIVEPALKGEPYLRGQIFRYVIFIHERYSQDVSPFAIRYVCSASSEHRKRNQPDISRTTVKSKARLADVGWISSFLGANPIFAAIIKPAMS
jgi:hypothetical protein